MRITQNLYDDPETGNPPIIPTKPTPPPPPPDED